MDWIRAAVVPRGEELPYYDRSWLVYTDYDGWETVVGGSRELIDRFLADPELETIEITPTTRIDWTADHVNRPHER